MRTPYFPAFGVKKISSQIYLFIFFLEKETWNGGPYPAQHIGHRAVISRTANFFLDSSNNLKSLPRFSFKAYAFPPGPEHLLCQKVRGPGESGVGARLCGRRESSPVSHAAGAMMWGPCASVFSDLQGPLPPPLSSDSQKSRVGRGCPAGGM